LRAPISPSNQPGPVSTHTYIVTGHPQQAHSGVRVLNDIPD